MAADALAIIPGAVLRNLADKLYEKRKNAALEIEGIIKQLSTAGEHDKIAAVIGLLTSDFAMSPQANHRKGGLIGLAAVTVGLTSEAAQHLELIVPPVLNAFLDQDSRVRYYACEALYNIAKVVRGDFIIYFNKIFDALCKLSADSDANVQSAAHLLDRLVKDIVTESDQFSIEEFIPLLRERMNVLNPYVRQFLVGWITVLDSVPDIDMLGFLPDFLDGLFNMLSDNSHEIRQQADAALSEFLQEIKNSPNVDYGRMAEILVRRAGSDDEFTRLTSITWINEFVKLGGEQLVPYYADILGAILPCISDEEEKIRVVARETNEELRAMKSDQTEGFDIGAILRIAERELNSEHEATRIEALHWFSTLLLRNRTEFLGYLEGIFEPLLNALSDPSDAVVLLVLEVHARIAEEPHHFHHLVSYLIHTFHNNHVLLERRGALIVRRLCVLLGAEKVYREFSTILEKEGDLDFASTMVQALNLILLTSAELAELRSLLKKSLVDSRGKDLFISLYPSWCHSPMATLPHATAADLASPDDDEEGLDLDVDLPAPPPISVSVSAPSPPVTTTTAANPNLNPTTPPNPTPSLDFWDEDEFEGIPVPEAPSSDASATPAESTPSDPSAADAAEAAPAPPRSPAELLRAFSIEIACVSFLICFLLNYFTGKKQNEAIALAWATKFATRDSIFDKNFSLLGTGDGKDTPLLLKEGQDVFKFYASGRRFCQGMLATMEMRARHDLLSKLVELVFPRKDTITFEVVMNEESMDHVMVAVARKKAAKTMQKEERDLQKFASVLPSAPAGKKWVADELAVVAESKEVAGDMISEAVLDQVLGEKAFEKLGKWFISLHFSDQLAGSYKKILSFKFVLPDANNMAEMTKLVALVPFYIDLIGRYKLSSHARSKTDAARTKAAQEAFRELQGVRQETLLRKKAEKKKLMEEAEAKLSAEVLRKKEEKERNRQMKKGAPKVKMLRS